MNVRPAQKQKGQVLVQVALLMVVLLAFLALAIDVGHVYAERRRMQNAADAGALAGAQEICFGDYGEAEGKAREYTITRNGAQTADIDIQGGTVTVVAGETVPTFFAGVIGFPTVDVSAIAAAACGKARSALGLWPIAFNEGLWYKKACGQKFLLWDDSDRADCDTWNCDVDGDEVPDLPLDGRAWADFSAVLADGEPDACDQSGCGNSELEDRINGYEKHTGEDCRSYVKLDTCMAGDSGVKTNSWTTAGEEEQVNRIVRFPLYDSNHIPSPCTMEHDPGNACGSERYWIVDFGCVRVLGAYKLCEKLNPNKCNGPRVILVEVACGENGAPHPDCFSEGGSVSTDPAGPGDVIAVGLIQ